MSFQLYRESTTPLKWSNVNGGTPYVIPDTPGYTNLSIGGDIKVLNDIKLSSITWKRPIGAAVTGSYKWMYVVLYDVTPSTPTFIGWCALSTTATSSKFLQDVAGGWWWAMPSISLLKDHTYRILVYIDEGETISDQVTPAAVPAQLADSIKIGDGYKGPVNLTYFISDVPNVGPGWYGDFELEFDKPYLEYAEIPPEPLVEASVGMFNIELPAQWLPVNWAEWELQYQTSTDNSTYDEWKQIETISYPETSYSFTDLSVKEKPFYRFRYRLKTSSSRTEWSEAANGGLAQFEASDLVGQLTGEQIQDGTITGENIANGTITGTLIAANTITASNITAGTITATEIKAGTITSNEIAANTIVASNIAANTITGAKIAAGTITATNIQTGTINNTHIQDGVIEGVKLKDGTITAKSIQAGTINNTLIQDGVIEGVKLKDGTITAKQIAAATITATEIKAHTITSNELSSTAIDSMTITGASIQTAKTGARVELDFMGIRGINASEVEKFNFDVASGILAVTAVVSTEDGSSIDTKHLAGTIKETQIADDSITTPKLVANAVTASKISVSNLAAISADLGTITAGTVTGALIRTGVSGPRVQLDSSGFFASDGTDQTFKINSSDGSTSIALAESAIKTVTAPVPVNPTAATNTTGWTTTVASDGFTPTYVISRTTTSGEYDSAPAGFKFTNNHPIFSGSSSMVFNTGTLKAGVTYILTVSLKNGNMVDCGVRVSFGNNVSIATREMASTDLSSSAFQQYSVFWTPVVDSIDDDTFVSISTSGTNYMSKYFFLDSMTVQEYSIPDSKQLSFTDSTSTKRGALYGYTNSNTVKNSNVALDAAPDSKATGPSSNRVAIVSDAGVEAEVKLTHDPGLNSYPKGRYTNAYLTMKDDSGDSFRTTLIDSEGYSSFLKVAPNFKGVSNNITDYGFVGTLPDNPIAGDRCFLYITSGTVWHLMYDKFDTWYKVGGPPLFSEVTTLASRASSTYGDLTSSVGPSITVPEKGSYLIEVGARIYTGPASEDIYGSYSIGATAATDNDAFNMWAATVPNGNISRIRNKGITAANTVVAAKYRTASGGSVQFTNRYLKIDAITLTKS